MFCKECGKEIMTDASFCYYCGRELEKEPLGESEKIENLSLEVKSLTSLLTRMTGIMEEQSKRIAKIENELAAYQENNVIGQSAANGVSSGISQEYNNRTIEINSTDVKKQEKESGWGGVILAFLLAGSIWVYSIISSMSSTCAKCHKQFMGAKYDAFIYGDGTGVLCEDCAGDEYGVDMGMFRK